MALWVDKLSPVRPDKSPTKVQSMLQDKKESILPSVLNTQKHSIADLLD